MVKWIFCAFVLQGNLAFAENLTCEQSKEVFNKIVKQVHAITLVGGFPSDPAELERSKVAEIFVDNLMSLADPEHQVFLQEDAEVLHRTIATELAQNFFKNGNCDFPAEVFALYQKRLAAFEKMIPSDWDHHTTSDAEIQKLAEHMQPEDEANPILMLQRKTWPRTEQEIMARFDIATAFRYKRLSTQFDESKVDRSVLLRTAYMNTMRANETGKIDNSPAELYPTLIVKALLRSLDPYSDIAMEEPATSNVEKSGYLGWGFDGLWITYEGILLRTLAQGGPMIKAGFLPGDIILAVDDKPLKGLPDQGVRDALKCHHAGDSITLTGVRAKQSVKMKVTCVWIKNSEMDAKTYEITPVPFGTNQAILYIQIHEFSTGLFEELIYDIQNHIRVTEIAGYIIDLRGNGGGDSIASWNLSSIFLGGGLEMRVVRADGTPQGNLIEQNDLKRDLAFTKPLVLLTDDGSASAAEHMAGNFFDYNRAIIVSDKKQTYGKGTAHSPFSLKDLGFDLDVPISLTITQGFFYLPSGRSPQEEGIKPHVLIGNNPEPHIPLMRDLNPHLPPPPRLSSTVTEKWISDNCLSGFLDGLRRDKLSAPVDDYDAVTSAGIHVIDEWVNSGFFSGPDHRACNTPMSSASVR